MIRNDAIVIPDENWFAVRYKGVVTLQKESYTVASNVAYILNGGDMGRTECEEVANAIKQMFGN